MERGRQRRPARDARALAGALLGTLRGGHRGGCENTAVSCGEKNILVLAGHAGVDWNYELKRLRWSILLNVHTDVWHERSPYRLQAQWMPLYEADGGTYHMTIIEGLMMARFLRLWERCADTIVICPGTRIKKDLYRGRVLSLGWDSVHRRERIMLTPEPGHAFRPFRRMLQ